MWSIQWNLKAQTLEAIILQPMKTWNIPVAHNTALTVCCLTIISLAIWQRSVAEGISPKGEQAFASLIPTLELSRGLWGWRVLLLHPSPILLLELIVLWSSIHGLLEGRHALAVHQHVQHRLPLDVLHSLLMRHHSEVVPIDLVGENKPYTWLGFSFSIFTHHPGWCGVRSTHDERMTDEMSLAKVWMPKMHAADYDEMHWKLGGGFPIISLRAASTAKISKYHDADFTFFSHQIMSLQW